MPCRPPAGRIPARHLCTYQLVIEVAQPLALQVGRLGQFLFPRGRYVYTGSAKRNLAARVARHLRKGKKLHWHVDYLLEAGGVQVVDVRYSDDIECAVNAASRGRTVAMGFGATDCREGCGSHLKYLGPPRRRKN
jgi:Uri superfamily endonuclease